MNSEVLQQIMTLFGFIGIGFVINKLGVINETSNRIFTSFLIKVTMPATILSSALSQQEIEAKILLKVMSIAVFVFILLTVISKVCVIIFHLEKTYQLMLLYSNLGFMGLPLISSIYGEENAFYVVLFMMVFNIHLFTYGIAVVQGKADNHKMSLRELLSPGVVCSMMAIVIVLLHVSVPVFVSDIVKGIGGITSPLALMLIGSQLAFVKISDLKNYRLYLMAALKLVVIPAVIHLILILLIGPGIVTNIATILVGLPVAGNVTMVSSEYGGNVSLAAQGTCISTLLSLISIPLVLAVLSQ